MAGKVEITAEVVEARLTALESMATDVDALSTTLGGIRGRQNASTWSTVDACATFATDYRAQVQNLQNGLVSGRARMSELQLALKETARTMTDLDQEVRDRLVALENRLAAAPAGPGDAPAASDPPAPPSGGGGGSW